MTIGLRRFQTYTLLLAILFSVVTAWDIGDEHDRHKCQVYSRDPLDGCDRARTLLVDALGRNKNQYRTVQSGKVLKLKS